MIVYFHDFQLNTKLLADYFKNQPGFIHPKTSDGVLFSAIAYKSAHIEGRGRYKAQKQVWMLSSSRI